MEKPLGPSGAADISKVSKSLFAHAAEKGGQVGIDRDKINGIIFELSGSSTYTKEKLEHRDAAAAWVAEAKLKKREAELLVCYCKTFGM